MSPAPSLNGGRALQVLLVGVNYAPEMSGVAPYTTGLALGLSKRGHDVRVVTSYPHYPAWRIYTRAQASCESVDGVEVRRVPHYIPRKPKAARRAAYELAFGASAISRRWRDPDVVLAVSPALLASALVACRVRCQFRLRRPALGVIVHDLYSRGAKETGSPTLAGIAGCVEGAVLRLADEVTVIHERFKRELVAAAGLEPSKVQVIRNWTHIATPELHNVGNARRQMGWREGELIVLHAGAIGIKQGLENVIRAGELADRRRLPVKFVLMGDGSERKRLERLARGLTTVQFLAPMEDRAFRRALIAADLLLVNEKPSVKQMAVPSKLTSYFAAGRPVLAATHRSSITAEEVESSGAGVVVEPDAPEALLEKALVLGSDPAQMLEIGRNGPIYCSTKLSEDNAIEEYDAWLRKLYDTYSKGGSSGSV